MKKLRVIIDGLLIVSVISLAYVVWWQNREYQRLSDDMSSLRAQLGQAIAASGTADTGASRRARPGADAKWTGAKWTDDSAAGARRADRESLEKPRSIQARVRQNRRGNGEGDTAGTEVDVDDPEVRMKLRDMIAEEQKYQRQQRWARFQEHREERTRERVRELAQATELDGATSQRLEDMLVVEVAEVSDLFRKAREEGDWHGLRDKIRKVHRETDQQAESLLAPEEFAKYEEMREENSRRFGGRRGRADKNETDDDNARR